MHSCVKINLCARANERMNAKEEWSIYYVLCEHVLRMNIVMHERHYCKCTETRALRKEGARGARYKS